MKMKKKVLLMGKSGSGKTSMRSIIFANYIARDTRRLGATIDVEHSHVRFLGNLVLNLWDCGGQEAFMENYFASQRDHIFKNVEVLIYVFDVESPTFSTQDLETFSNCIDAMRENSSSAKVFCLIHKMDLVPDAEKAQVFDEKKHVLEEAGGGFGIKCYATSIWDETLYRAWSQIVYTLIPNIKLLESNLSYFRDSCEADEVILFERATFLVISHSSRRPHYDSHRFEKISNMVKQFKLSCRCSKVQAQFQALEVSDGNSFSTFIESLTPNTFVMVIVSDVKVEPAAVKLNIQLARKHFEKLEIGG